MTRNLYTYQEFMEAENRADFILRAIDRHRSSAEYKIAMDADLYDRQMNSTITTYVRTLMTLTGSKVVNYTASNSRIASNFFHRLNTQRVMYSLGNGVSFVESSADSTYKDGADATKERLGKHFDHDIQDAAYKSLIHGVCFCFWNVDRLHNFPITEFVPFWDEEDGTLRAGARFWRLSPDTPLTVVLYEEDGFTKYRTVENSRNRLEEVVPKKAYIEKVRSIPADGNEEIVGTQNYSSLPIVPLWGSKLHQSTLVGLKQAIDSYDLIRSGFANDITDCAQVYWIIENAGGMTENDLAQFLDRLVFNHIAQADTLGGSKITPYSQEIPYEARQAYLNDIRAEIYESFGALDVHAVAAGSTNDHIDAAYQPMDEEASDFEFQVSECVRQILALIGIDDSPVFKRKRISNEKDQVEMLVQEAQWLDRETILRKLPNIKAEEIQGILDRSDEEDVARMGTRLSDTQEEDVTEEDGRGAPVD